MCFKDNTNQNNNIPTHSKSILIMWESRKFEWKKFAQHIRQKFTYNFHYQIANQVEFPYSRGGCVSNNSTNNMLQRLLCPRYSMTVWNLCGLSNSSLTGSHILCVFKHDFSFVLQREYCGGTIWSYHCCCCLKGLFLFNLLVMLVSNISFGNPLWNLKLMDFTIHITQR